MDLPQEHQQRPHPPRQMSLPGGSRCTAAVAIPGARRHSPPKTAARPPARTPGARRAARRSVQRPLSTRWEAVLAASVPAGPGPPPLRPPRPVPPRPPASAGGGRGGGGGGVRDMSGGPFGRLATACTTPARSAQAASGARASTSWRGSARRRTGALAKSHSTRIPRSGGNSGCKVRRSAGNSFR